MFSLWELNEFLEFAERLVRSLSAHERYGKVLQAIARLQHAHSKSDLDLYNLESIFGAFEMAKTLGYELTEGVNAEVLILQLQALISETLEHYMHYNLGRWSPGTQGKLQHFPGYGILPQIVKQLRDKADNSVNTAFLTLNYDVSLEYTFYAGAERYDYCLSGLGTNPSQSPILKLHGSINWAQCDSCKKIVPYKVEDCVGKALNNVYRFTSNELIGPLQIAVDQKRSNLQCCGKFCNSSPVIVPPSWNKLQYGEPLSVVWRRAATELKSARNIFVFGYSLPETDVFFRHLYAIGSMSEQLLNRFWVFDPNKQMETRWRSLLGPAALRRFEFFAESFPMSLQILAKRLNISM